MTERKKTQLQRQEEMQHPGRRKKKEKMSTQGPQNEKNQLQRQATSSKYPYICIVYFTFPYPEYATLTWGA